MALIKPLDTLTADDLALFALWESTGADADGEPTERVRPVDLAAVPVDADEVTYHVACDIELGNGRRLGGHVAVRNGELAADSPTVVDDDGAAYSLERPPARHRQAAFAALFGGDFLDVFPVRWQLRLSLAGEAATLAGELSLQPDAGPRLH